MTTNIHSLLTLCIHNLGLTISSIMVFVVRMRNGTGWYWSIGDNSLYIRLLAPKLWIPSPFLLLLILCLIE